MSTILQYYPGNQPSRGLRNEIDEHNADDRGEDADEGHAGPGEGAAQGQQNGHHHPDADHGS